MGVDLMPPVAEGDPSFETGEPPGLVPGVGGRRSTLSALEPEQSLKSGE
jgi:hypothetical protein